MTGMTECKFASICRYLHVQGTLHAWVSLELLDWRWLRGSATTLVKTLLPLSADHRIPSLYHPALPSSLLSAPSPLNRTGMHR